jgi:hypothetical protein
MKNISQILGVVLFFSVFTVLSYGDESVKERLRRAKMQEAQQAPSAQNSGYVPYYGEGDKEQAKLYLKHLSKVMPEQERYSIESIQNSAQSEEEKQRSISSIQESADQQRKIFEDWGIADGEIVDEQKFDARYEEQKSRETQAVQESVDAQGKAMLRALATACEAFATAHQGKYPTSWQDLVEAKPPYINTEICGKTTFGFEYECNFSEQGYEHIARPAMTENHIGSTTFTITTGGTLTP